MNEKIQKDAGSDASRSDPETADQERAELKDKAEQSIARSKRKDTQTSSGDR